MPPRGHTGNRVLAQKCPADRRSAFVDEDGEDQEHGKDQNQGHAQVQRPHARFDPLVAAVEFSGFDVNFASIFKIVVVSFGLPSKNDLVNARFDLT